MGHPVSSIATEPSTPPRGRRRAFLVALAVLALVVVVGSAWALGRNGAATTQRAVSDQHGDDQASAVSHADSQSHGAAPSEVDHHEEDAPTDHHEGDSQADPTAHGDAHEAAPAHGDEQAEHDEADAHGAAAPDVSPRTKQIVLGGFAGVNALVVLTAALWRRQNPPRLPKHLQR